MGRFYCKSYGRLDIIELWWFVMEKKKIKVMTLIYNMYNGGAQKIVLNYLRDFKDDSDIDFKVFTYKMSNLSYCDEIIKKEGLNVEYLDVPQTKFNIPRLRKPFLHRIARKTWNKAIIEFKPDIVHVHITPFLEDTLDSIIDCNVPIRFDTLHSNPLRFKGYILKVIRRAFQKEHFIPVCVTKEQSQVAKGYYGFETYEIVYNGVNIEEIKSKIISREEARKKYRLSKNTYIVLGVGRLEKIKRFDILIESFAKLHKIKKDSILILAGDGVERKRLEQLAYKLNVVDSVLFLGYESNIIPLYCAADVLAVTSTSESLSLVLVEAQICELRAVISDGVPSEGIITNKVRRMEKNAGIDEWSQALLDVNFVGKKVNEMEDYEVHRISKNMKNIYLKYYEKYKSNGK